MNARSKILLSFVAVACLVVGSSTVRAAAAPSLAGAQADRCAAIVQPADAEQAVQAPVLAGAASAAQLFADGVDEAAQELGKGSQWRRLTPQQRRARAEFVFSNMLFVAAHELGHALVSELDLMVLGREEDVADAYATLGMLKCGSEASRRVLVEAAKGWFLSAQRDKKAGEAPDYYERHGLDAQRAYQVVCMMVGSDPVAFKDLADETGLPEERRRSCVWDYETASRSWERALAPHQRAAGQPKMPVQVQYKEATGKLAVYARAFSAAGFLEAIVAGVVDRFSWPAAITVEMRSCGEPNARWTITNRTLHVCYELAEEFVELYRDYGGERTLAQVRPGSKPQRTAARPHNIVHAVASWRGSIQGKGAVR